MRKNIVIIPSLILCSFIALPLLGMEEASAKGNEYHPITTNPVEGVNLTGLTHLNLPEPQTIDPMQQSVMMPMGSKTIGLKEHVRTILFNNIRNVSTYLSDQTFDVENRRHFDILNAAIQDAVKNDDINSLTTILALCRSTKEYRESIRINDYVAKEALDFLTSDANSVKYDLGIQLANKNIEESDRQYRLEYNKKTEAFISALTQLIAAHRQDITTLSNKFDKLQVHEIAQAQAPISNLGALNKSTRDDAKRFVNLRPIKTKHNEVAEQAKVTDMKLDFLVPVIKSVPTIIVDNTLQLTDK